jgi:hypothetical protein
LIRRSSYGIIDFSEDDYDDNDDNSIKSYCKHCLEYGFKVQLRNRVYPEGQIPIDHDQWRMCHECGLIVPVYELEKEASIKDVVETVDNPFEQGMSFLGVDKRTSVGGKNARKKRERQKQLDDINDDDVKRELAKGHTLLSYTEYQPQ